MLAYVSAVGINVVFGSWSGVSRGGIHKLERFDGSVLVLEVLAIAALVASLGPVASVWLNGWGLLLAAMILGGIALPLFLNARPSATDSRIAPMLVLLGGLILRAVIVFSTEQL